MLSIDEEMLRGLSLSRRAITNVDVYSGETLVTSNIKVSSGTVSADRAQRARRTLNAEIPLNTWESLGFDVISGRLTVAYGADYGSKWFTLPLGAFRVDSTSRTNRGVVAVTGVSYEAYLIEDVFVSPRKIPKNSPIIQTIIDYITDSFPGEAKFEFAQGYRPNYNARTAYDLVAEVGKSVWDVVETLAFKINTDVYCSPEGKFRFAERPTMLNTKSVAKLREGPEGVLVALNRKNSRDETFNGVLAIGSSTNSEVPPVSWFAADMFPGSPTFWQGSFGHKAKILQADEALTTLELCRSRAEGELEMSRKVSRTLDLSALPNPALEPDDMVEISMLDGTLEHHMITMLTFPLGTNTGWMAQTLSEKDLDTLNPEPPLVPEPEPEPEPE